MNDRKGFLNAFNVNFKINEKITKALAKPKTDEIEKSIIDSLNKKIDECKSKLGTDYPWPPPPPTNATSKSSLIVVRQPVKVKLSKPKAEIEFTHTHYQVSRITLPPPLFDEFGRPLRKRFDCMISYHWGIQNLVHEIYMDLHMRRVITWFDIWGYMEANTYDAMATAVESSRVLLVFLTDNYQKSDNCMLEFKYAVFCGKAFVFILTDPNLKLEPWIEPHVKEHPCFLVKKYEDVTVMDNNVAMIDSITQALRAIADAQNDYDVYETSEEIVRLKEMLIRAKDAVDAKLGTSRFKICERCKKRYDETSPSGCKAHPHYYLGGDIIEGRWVCCNQQEIDSMGCQPVNHSDAKRTWTCDPAYGTYTWEPH